MAQLPPKAPNMTPNNHQRYPSMDQSFPSNTNNSSWVDEFLEFSSSKRGCHRRSISDSVAFLEITPTEDAATVDFEQFMSIFTDDNIGANSLSCSNPSSPSDHNNNSSINGNEDNVNGDVERQLMLLNKQLKTEPNEEEEEEEEDGSCKSSEAHQAQQHQLTAYQDMINSDDNKIVDPKRIKRILANRQSAQRSRIRKLHYISELERSVTSLQSEVSVLSPRVAYLDQQRMLLTLDNGILNQRIAALAQDKIFKDAHQEALKREIERLRQVYYQQNMKKMESDNSNTKSQSASPMDTNCPLELEQLAN